MPVTLALILTARRTIRNHRFHIDIDLSDLCSVRTHPTGEIRQASVYNCKPASERRTF